MAPKRPEPPRRPDARGGPGRGDRDQGRGASGSGSGPARGRGRGPRGRGSRGRGSRGGSPGRGSPRPQGTEVPLRQAFEKYRNDMMGGVLDAEPPGAPSGNAEGVPRPGEGTAGRRVRVETNHFPLTCGFVTAYMYDVTVLKMSRPKGAPRDAPLEPEKPADGQEKKLPADLCQFAMENFMQQEDPEGTWVYDGWKGLFSKAPIPDMALGVAKPIEFNEPGYVQKRTFQIQIKFTKEVQLNNMEDRECLRVLDLIMKQPSLSNPDTVVQGRSVYTTSGTSPVDALLEIRKGFAQTVRNTQSGLQFILDTKAAAFLPSSPVLDVISHVTGWIKGSKKMGNEDQKKLLAILRNKRIQVTNPFKRKHTCKGLVKPANEQLFQMGERELSVADYFAESGRELQFPNLPCLDVSTSPARPVFLPPEICSIIGEKKNPQKLQQVESSQVIRASAMKPDARMKEIGGNVDSINKGLSEFHSKINREAITVDARVLPSPALEYGNQKFVDVGNQGAWNLTKGEFLQGGDLTSWAVACVGVEKIQVGQGLEEFLVDLNKKMKSLGINVADSPPIIFGKDVEKAIDEAAEKAEKKFKDRPKMILAVLRDDRTKGEKGRVKARSDCHLGVVSQVMTASAAKLARYDSNGSRTYCYNISLKINTKIGGKNCRIPKQVIEKFLGHENIMLMGADVTHSPVRGAVSIAAVVASMDSELCQFASYTLEMDPPQKKKSREIIHSLSEAVNNLLCSYQQKNMCLPDAILFYRDGIADNQFRECQDTEIPAIDQACADLDPGYKPKIGFIVVQKRHLTRFKPTDGNMDKSGNVLPGTVVDTKICHPDYFDFYLNSHAGILGTSKAAHYHVLRDDIGFGPDGAQLFTNYLCYLYHRCTRSVSYCPPAYYAHLAAARARELAGQGCTMNPALASSFHFI